MAFFRVLGGEHTESEKDETGKLKVYKRGEIVETDKDLVKLFGDKFYKLSDGEVSAERSGVAQAARDGASGLAATAVVEDDGLEGMKVDALRKMAEEMEIELDPGMKKDEIIRVIRTAMETQ